jgi:AcrR family transcriptional regulator
MGERRSGTRDKIQTVALELFAEHGYEKTSLREIAERLDVSKAALYYHFKTKEDIVVSLFEDFIAGIDGLVTWGRDQPRTPETRRELIQRYARLTRERPPGMMRFIQESRTTLRELTVGCRLHDRFHELIDTLTRPEAEPATRLKAAMALITIDAAMVMLQDTDTTEAERHAAGVKVALELVSA